MKVTWVVIALPCGEYSDCWAQLYNKLQIILHLELITKLNENIHVDSFFKIKESAQIE